MDWLSSVPVYSRCNQTTKPSLFTMLYLCPKSGAILQSIINTEFTCTCIDSSKITPCKSWLDRNKVFKKFLLILHVNTCTSIHTEFDIFTYGYCTSVGGRLHHSPTPPPSIPSLHFTLENFCMFSYLWYYWF